MMGAALGGLKPTFFPRRRRWIQPLIGMGAILGGIDARLWQCCSALEPDVDINVMLPLLVAVRCWPIAPVGLCCWGLPIG